MFIRVYFYTVKERSGEGVFLQQYTISLQSISLELYEGNIDNLTVCTNLYKKELSPSPICSQVKY